jgi:two-component system LytT family response regulator
MILSCIAIDDEPLALEVIKHYCALIPGINLSHTFLNASEGKKYIETSNPDLLFLDIQMPDINGLELIQSLQHPPIVIITTAFDQYAAFSFDLNVADYLLKPFEFERFEKAVNKVIEIKNFINGNSSANKNYFFVKSNYELVKIEINEIEYFESQGDYLNIYLSDHSFVRTLMSFKKIEEFLPSLNFLRVHRGFMISTSKIKSINTKSIKLSYTDIPIGDSYKFSLDNYITSNR